jgi:hypothetical protein
MYKILAGVWSWYPPVGVFIAILALVGVLVPLFRDLTTVGKREKAIWTFVMFALVWLEIRSIYLDRNAHDREQAAARAEQLKQFGEIAKGIGATLDSSQKQFDATMARIETTMQTSEKTLRNTQPVAALEFRSMTVYGPSLPIAVGRQLEFNISFTNVGNDSTRNSNYDARLYVRRLDDTEAQREIANDFDQWWGMSQHPGGAAIRPNYPSFFSFRSLPLTENEVSGILNHSLTLYVLIRFTWTDRTGRWASDECFAFQDPTHDFEVGHPCAIFTRDRYTPTQH